MNLFNIFQVNVPFLYPLKTSDITGFLMFSGVIENFRYHWFSNVFRGYRKGTLVWNDLKLQIKTPRQLYWNSFCILHRRIWNPVKHLWWSLFPIDSLTYTSVFIVNFKLIELINKNNRSVLFCEKALLKNLAKSS